MSSSVLSPFIFLLFAVGFVRCVSVFRNNSEPSFQRLNRAVPDLAPYEEDVRVDALGGLDVVRRAHIRKLFSRAFYEPCVRKDFTVKPVYFWPGERVDLPCRMCARDAAHNGKMKYWSFVRQKFLVDFHRLDQLPASAWTLLDENATRSFRPHDLYYERRVNMPAFTSHATHVETRRSVRPPMTFVQRDGRLKILTAESNAYGLYRCFDDSDRDTVSHVYYLIPITPVFRMEYVEVFKYECSSSHPKYDLNQKYDRFDATHRFHMVSPYVSDPGRNFGPADWNKLPFEDVAFSQPSAFHNFVHVLGATDKRGRSLPLNLKIFVHWSPWSQCDSALRYRTREGYCHIGKADPSIKYAPSDKEKLIIHAKGLDFLMLIHKMIETVDEFRRDGIPLFSGVLTHLLAGETGLPVTQCMDYIYITQIASKGHKILADNRAWVQQLVFDPLMERSHRTTHRSLVSDAYMDVKVNPCFFYNASYFMQYVMYGYTLDQNQKC